MKLLRLLTCILVFSMFPALSFAWGPIGHMTVAYVAYERLSPAAKARVRDLLKMNPDYASWERQIPAGTSADDHDRAIFIMASVWPDDIKGESNYSDDGSNGGNTPGGAASSQNLGYGDLLRHKYWHFVDDAFSPDNSPLPPTPVPNARTQIAVFRTVLNSASSDDPLKSYDLVWLIHLVGDVHQPLHATTRVTAKFPQGDAGGNSVKLFGDAASNLHTYWDDLPGSECKYCADKMQCVNRAIVLGRSLRPDATKAARNLDADTWIHESFLAAEKEVYAGPIGTADPYTIIPNSQYDLKAYKLAVKRVRLAGARLAGVLNSELK